MVIKTFQNVLAQGPYSIFAGYSLTETDYSCLNVSGYHLLLGILLFLKNVSNAVAEPQILESVSSGNCWEVKLSKKKWACQILNGVKLHTLGVHAVRLIYKKLLPLPPPGSAELNKAT